MDQDIAACAGIVQKGDPDRFAAVMAAPVAARAKLFPLFAFNIEVARAPWVTQETMIAEMRLQWWRDALDDIATGATVRRHEVVTPLARILTPAMAHMLDKTIEARRWDIYKDPFEDEQHFQNYIEDTAGNLLTVAAQLLGQADPHALCRVGFAHGLSRYFLAIPELEAQKRIPLVDGQPDAIRRLAQGAYGQLNSIRKERSAISAQAAQALICCWQDRSILSQVIANPHRVAEGTLGHSEFRKRMGLMWRGISGRW